jgi:hypothetical protein
VACVVVATARRLERLLGARGLGADADPVESDPLAAKRLAKLDDGRLCYREPAELAHARIARSSRKGHRPGRSRTCGVGASAVDGSSSRYADERSGVELRRARPTMDTRARGVAFLFAVLMGCASGPSGTRSEEASASAPRSGNRVVLLPANLTVPAPPELRASAPKVDSALKAFLDERELRVSRVADASAMEFWLESISSARTSGVSDSDLIDHALRSLAERLRREGVRFDALIAPALVYRQAVVYGGRAKWDGVARTIAVDDTDPSIWKADEVFFEGEFTGISLYVLVYSPEGDGLYEGIGGLDLAHAAVSPRHSNEYELRLRDEFLDDAERIAQGIEIALGQYLRKARGR